MGCDGKSMKVGELAVSQNDVGEKSPLHSLTGLLYFRSGWGKDGAGRPP